MLLLTIFKPIGDNLGNELFISDHIVDHYEEIENSAESLVEAIEDEMSIRMIWALRNELARAIDRHNDKCGTKFGHDTPEEK